MKPTNVELTYTALIAAALVMVATAVAGRFNLAPIGEVVQVTLLIFGLVLAALTNAAADYIRPRGNTQAR